MDQQDKSFMTVFVVLMAALLVLSVVIFMVSRLVSVVSRYEGDDGSRASVQLADRLAPVGRVVLASAEPEGGATAPQLTADQVVQQACASCHVAGVLNAPRIGDGADWGKRYEQGLDTLVGHAIHGFNAMPAKGGNAALTDEQVRSAVVKMLADSGIEVAAAEAEAAPAESPAAAPAAPADEAQQPTASEPEPVAETPKEAETVAGTAPVESQSQGGAAASAKMGGEEDAAPAEPEGEASSTSEKMEPEAAAESEAAPTQVAAAPPAVDHKQGEQLYNTSGCAACHVSGVLNAPMLGDKEAWAPRIAQGMETLVDHAVNGFKSMPPKGGNVTLTDEQVAEIVGYMVSTVQ